MRSRLGRQEGKYPLFPSSQPEWLVLTEWATLDEATGDGTAADVIARYQREFEGQLSGLDYNVAGLSATLLNINNWTV